MTPSAHARIRRLALCTAACAAALLVALAGNADAGPTLFMRVDGVKGEKPAKQPLGDDAFAVLNFAVSTDGEPGKPGETTTATGERFGELAFTLPISAPAVALWQLAAQRNELGKASLVAVDPATGATRYRVDLEGVVVRSMSFQSLGTRNAAVGALAYQRIRISAGDKGPSASWDRAKNAPWK
jgi:hypothetical protein